MKKRTKRKILILIFTFILIIALIKIFSNSRAEKLIDITANIIDNSGLIADTEYNTQAKNEGESGVSLILPDVINQKKIGKFFIESKNIEGKKSANEENISNGETTITKTMQSGEKIYLTEEEINNKQINLKVEYDKKQKNDLILYNQVLKENVDSKEITIKGFTPDNAKIVATPTDVDTIKTISNPHINEKTTIKVAYDIKIFEKDKKFEPNIFGEAVEVTISGIDTANKDKEQYTLLHIKDNNIVEEIDDIQIEQNKLIFNANEFSIYVLLSEPVKTDTQTPEKTPKEQITTDTIWSGSIATKFPYGEGSKEKPFLISNGEELAYLGEQVKDGQTFENKFIQLVSDIDLANKNWNPIGNMDNPFKGTFDGAGHTIANANILISKMPKNRYDSYGLFGTIGGSDVTTSVKNLELININIDIALEGKIDEEKNAGIYIGSMVGTAYKNSNVTNIIAKNCNIIDNKSLEIGTKFDLSVGGIIGCVINEKVNDNKCFIDNCFSNVQINLDSITSKTPNLAESRANYNVGGIVGTIIKQNIWPQNSLYVGNIKSDAVTGPIFGTVIGETGRSNSNDFNKIWNGIDIDEKLTANNIYYSNYKVSNGTSEKNFTSEEKSGLSNSKLSTSNTNIGYVQGVNKGIYQEDISALLDMFNKNVNDSNKYVNWEYQDNTFTFKEKITTKITEKVKIDMGKRSIKLNITDPYKINEYTHEWYRNDVLNKEFTKAQAQLELNYMQDENIMIITKARDYYTLSKIFLKKEGVNIAFNINKNNNTVKASLTGEGLKYTNLNEYTFEWYKYDIGSNEEKIKNANSLELAGLEEGIDYKLVATNNKKPQLSTENIFSYGERNVIYVDDVNGNDDNDGMTDKKPLKTLEIAYSKIETNTTRNKNVIVIMGTYNNEDYMNTPISQNYNKQVTITGKYGAKDYKGELYFNEEKYLTADTTIQNLILNGNQKGATLYLQGYNLTMGNKITMKNYPNVIKRAGLMNENAPSFDIFGGWKEYNETSLPRNNTKILINGGTYSRIVGR